MSTGVGRAFAFGDYGTDAEAKKSLEELAAKYGQTETGMAASLVLANAHSRDLRDLHSGGKLRTGNKKGAQAQFDKMATAMDEPGKLVRLACAIAAPTESRAPILDLAADYLRRPAAATRTVSKGRGKKRKGRATAAAIAADVAAPGGAAAASDALDLLKEIRRSFAGGK